MTIKHEPPAGAGAWLAGQVQEHWAQQQSPDIGVRAATADHGSVLEEEGVVRVTGKVRRAPFPEWVQMYRQGIPAKKIADLVHAPYSTIMYHLARAAEKDANLRTTHTGMARPVPKVTAAGRRNLEPLFALYATTGKLPTPGAGTLEYRALGAWLQNRRHQAAEGTLSPVYAARLAGIPDWTQHTTKKERDEVRWNILLAELIAYRAAGNDWPRHQRTDDPAERRLGLWVRSQRISKRASTLNPDKQTRLDTAVPGWHTGRAPNGRQALPQKTTQVSAD